MPRAGATIDGLAFLSRQYRDLEKALDARGMERAGEMAAAPVLKSMQAKVPVDQGDTKRALAVDVRSKDGKVDADVGVTKNASGRPDTTRPAFPIAPAEVRQHPELVPHSGAGGLPAGPALPTGR